MVKKFNEMSSNDKEIGGPQKPLHYNFDEEDEKKVLNFENEKIEIIEKGNKFLSEYEDFIMLISSKQWRSSGQVIKN